MGGFLSFSLIGVPSDSDPSLLSNKLNGVSSVKPNRPSLAKILLSLDGNLAKQQALSHVLSSLQIMYARYDFNGFRTTLLPRLICFSVP